MKSKSVKSAIIGFVTILIITNIIEAQIPSILDQEFDLAGAPAQEIQYFKMESRLISYALDGKRVGTDIFRLQLKCVPAKIAGKEGDEYTCVRFTVQQGNNPEVEIPVLKNWKYIFKEAGIDEQGQVFGIDHSKFENLTDSNGNAIPPDKSYHVYNAFIDFHSFCNVFAAKAPEGSGIQDLTEIGQKIVHAAAFSEPPVNLGANVSEGSFFKNGEITLEFKGLSVVNGSSCALIEYDSGESSFKMTMNPMPNMEVQTTGSSHYKGDIYKDLTTNWVQKVTMIEFVISETTLPMPPNKINSVNERQIIIRNVSEEEF
ncbi:MAG: hypothetical protein J7K53_09980 [Bacteroidales bacterium]|nr:hypothetical protein [Bacteroidales bacterium]